VKREGGERLVTIALDTFAATVSRGAYEFVEPPTFLIGVWEFARNPYEVVARMTRRLLRPEEVCETKASSLPRVGVPI
jgi:hypothetical protein